MRSFSITVTSKLKQTKKRTFLLHNNWGYKTISVHKSNSKPHTDKNKTKMPLDQMVLHKNNLFLANYKPREKKKV